MQSDMVWEGIFKGLETRQVRRIEPIRPFFLPLKISKQPRITIFSVSCHSCHCFSLFLMVVQFIMQGSIWIQRRDTVFTLETRFGVCQGLMFSVSFPSIAGQLIWLLKSHKHLARQAMPVSCLWQAIADICRTVYVKSHMAVFSWCTALLANDFWFKGSEGRNLLY